MSNNVHIIKLTDITKYFDFGRYKRICYTLNYLLQSKFFTALIVLQGIIKKELKKQLITQLKDDKYFKTIKSIEVAFFISNYHYNLILSGSKKAFDLTNMILIWKLLEDLLVRSKYYPDDSIIHIKDVRFLLKLTDTNLSPHHFHMVITTKGEYKNVV